MAGTRILSENFFDVTMFPSHTLTAEEETEGKGVERVGSARRQARDHWTPTTANSETYVQAACDRVRAADTLILDRGHNLGGKTIELRGSFQSSFATYTSVFSVTVPTQVFAGQQLTNKQPVRTEEGAVVVPFALQAYPYWRLVISAMGSGLKPQVVGLWLGASFAPAKEPLKPWDDEGRQLVFSETLSPSLWAASERKAQRKSNEGTPMMVRLADEQEYTKARYHVGSLVWRGHVVWYIPDTDQAERAWLGTAPAGTYGMPFGDRNARDLVLTLVEHEPRPN